jgi:hypothetical protein
LLSKQIITPTNDFFTALQILFLYSSQVWINFAWTFEPMMNCLRDLADTMARLSLVPDEFEGKKKVNQWLQTLLSMQASDELSESQVRQLLFALETSYNAFNRLLHP